MPAFVKCNVCDAPGTLAESRDVAEIGCNVRCYAAEKFTVWRCNHCQSLHAKDSVDLDYYYANYRLANGTLDYFSRRCYGGRLGVLRQAGIERGHRILDHGCGPGSFVRYLNEQGFSGAAGYDPYQSAHGNAARLESDYDVITSYDVIEHDEEPRQYLAALEKRLRPGGLLAIYKTSAAHIRLTERDACWLHLPYHRHILSESALLQLGAAQGLETVLVHRRCWLDTPFPAVNTRFLWGYVLRNGNVVDATLEPVRIGTIVRSPALWFYSLFGYLFPARQGMTVVFRKPLRGVISRAA